MYRYRNTPRHHRNVAPILFGSRHLSNCPQVGVRIFPLPREGCSFRKFLTKSLLSSSILGEEKSSSFLATVSTLDAPLRSSVGRAFDCNRRPTKASDIFFARAARRRLRPSNAGGTELLRSYYVATPTTTAPTPLPAAHVPSATAAPPSTSFAAMPAGSSMYTLHANASAPQ